TRLRRALGFPGMAVLQFGFGTDDPANVHHPLNHAADVVVYTGTHDNDTTRGWFDKAPAWERARALETVGGDGGDIAWRMMLALYGSAAERAIVPVQDVLGLGSEARMNTPSVPEGNWEFRLESGALTPELAERLRAAAQGSGR
ncbi:MAG TPA: 4-alpha-glucanotransferase, partial [Candidatus Eisenbacteria bacterium]|nr:4-alpha-glucanotransferase [Candidatus Eisenbacteria bacterium]